MDAQSPPPHHREKSRTRSQLIREKEDSVSRDNSVSHHSIEIIQSVKSSIKKPQSSSMNEPLINNISTQSVKWNDNHINPIELQQVLDNHPSTFKHLRSKSMQSHKSHKHLINGISNLNEQDSITFNHGVGDKESDGLGTMQHSIRELFAIISQTFMHKYDELYHQYNLVKRKLNDVKQQNELLRDQNSSFKKKKKDLEKQNKTLYLEIDKLKEEKIGLSIDANQLQESEDDNQPQNDNNDEYEITPAPVTYDDNDNKEIRKDTPIHVHKTKEIKLIHDENDDSKEEEKKNDGNDDIETTTSTDQFVFDENLPKMTMHQPQHQTTNSDDSQSLFGSQNVNQLTGLLDHIDINTINETDDNDENIPTEGTYINESESFQISVNGTPIGGHRPSVPSYHLQNTLNTKEPMLLARESVLNLHGTGKVGDLKNKFESIVDDNNYHSLNNLRNEHSISMSGSQSTQFRTTSKARHKHKRKPKGVKKHKSVVEIDDNDQKSPSHGTHLYENTPTRVKTLSPRKMTKQKSKRSALTTPPKMMSKTGSKKDVVIGRQQSSNIKSSIPRKNATAQNYINNRKVKPKQKPKPKPKPNVPSSKKGYHYAQKNGHSQKSSMLQLFSKGKKQRKSKK